MGAVSRAEWIGGWIGSPPHPLGGGSTGSVRGLERMSPLVLPQPPEEVVSTYPHGDRLFTDYFGQPGDSYK
jgi:hypothetical protein